MSVSEDKTLYEVEIAGTSVKLRSSHGEKAVHELVDMVNQKVQEIQGAKSQVSYQNALLLASLHIAEELRQLKNSAKKELDLLEASAQEILSDLESSPISQIRLDN